ncbi:LysR family transcriptional regulator [Massilia sp. SR12]
MTQPTVGRHVSELESSLGLALFTRSHTGLLATATALLSAAPMTIARCRERFGSPRAKS